MAAVVVVVVVVVVRVVMNHLGEACHFGRFVRDQENPLAWGWIAGAREHDVRLKKKGCLSIRALEGHAEGGRASVAVAPAWPAQSRAVTLWDIMLRM